MPATEPLQVGVVVVVSVLDVVAVGSMCNAARAIVHECLALSTGSGFHSLSSLRPVARESFAPV